MTIATNSYPALLASLFAPESGPPGYDRADLAAAESRLARPLPATLAAHYLAYGRLAFQRAHDRLLAPAELRIKNGMLLFYEENQQVFHWAIPLDSADDDPPVLQSVDDADDEWLDDHDHLSQFFSTMLLHHRARMQPCVTARAPRDAVRALDAHALVLPGCHRELATFHRVGGVVIETNDFNDDDERVLVLAGARDAQELRTFQANHAFEWT